MYNITENDVIKFIPIYYYCELYQLSHDRS